MNKFIKTIINNIFFGVKISWESSNPLFILKLLYTFVTVFIPIAISYVWKNILNELSDSVLVSITLLLVVYISLKLFVYLSSVLNDYLINRYYDARSFYIDNIIINKMSRVDLSYFDSSSMADRTERIRANFGVLHDTSWQVFDIITEIANIIITFSILSAFNPFLGIIIIILLIPDFIYNQKHTKKMYDLSLSQAHDVRLEQYYINNINNVNSQYELKLNNYGSYFLSKADNIWSNLFRVNRKHEIKHAKYQALFTVIGTMGSVLTLLFSAIKAVSHQIGLGDLQFYFNMSNTLQNQVNALFRDVNSFLVNNIKIDELRKFINEQPENEAMGDIILTDAPKIEFENVSFSYPNSSALILNNCSFTIMPNERVALIGLNGTGKTTIIKLLFGFYYAQNGHIKLNDIEIKEYNIYSVRKIFGVLFQDYVTYCLPLREIISLPEFEERFNEQLIDNAALISGFSNVISNWKDRYDTVLGRYYASNGRDLSGGQWQLLCLTRAYFQNAPVMVLDEPSASLDPISENRIFEQLYKLSFGKGSIVITHQLSNIKLSDRILLLDEGSVKEAGTHKELMNKKGLYAKLYNIQAKKYT